MRGGWFEVHYDIEGLTLHPSTPDGSPDPVADFRGLQTPGLEVAWAWEPAEDESAKWRESDQGWSL